MEITFRLICSGSEARAGSWSLLFSGCLPWRVLERLHPRGAQTAVSFEQDNSGDGPILVLNFKSLDIIAIDAVDLS